MSTETDREPLDPRHQLIPVIQDIGERGGQDVSEEVALEVIDMLGNHLIQINGLLRERAEQLAIESGDNTEEILTRLTRDWSESVQRRFLPDPENPQINP